MELNNNKKVKKNCDLVLYLIINKCNEEVFLAEAIFN